MVKLIMGLKGAGKTKTLIDLVNKAASEEHGDVICIERDNVLTYDIPHSVRLIQTAEYDFTGTEFFRGFVCGLFAGNYDITHIFIDGLNKICHKPTADELERILNWCDAFSERRNVKFTITVSYDAETATEGIRKYL